MPNAAPMINSAMFDSFSPKTNDILMVNITASDSDSDPLTFDYVWKVNGTTVKTTIGTSSFSDTLDLSQSGNGNKGDTVSIVVTPYDPYTSGMTGSNSVMVANSAPTFSISNQENLRGDVVSFQVNASDADGDTLSYGAMALPPGLSINSSTGLISGTVSSSAATNNPYLASVTVNDGGGNVNQNFNWTIVNHAPTLTGHTFYVEKNQPLGNINFLDYADDQDSNDTLTFTPGTGPWQGQLTYNNGIWTYTPASNWTGTDTINGTVSDGAANSTSAYFPFHVVLQTPSQLYATYLAAVAVADGDYADDVEAAIVVRDAAIATARTAAQDDADVAYGTYQSDLADALAAFATSNDVEVFWQAEETAWEEYDDALTPLMSDLVAENFAILSDFDAAAASALATWQDAEADAWDVYDSAMATLPGSPSLSSRVEEPAFTITEVELGYLSADLRYLEQLYADYVTAVDEADTDYEAAVAGRAAAIEAARAAGASDADALYAIYETAVAQALAIFDAAIAVAQSDRDYALDAAYVAWESATEPARTDYDAAVSDAYDDYDAAIAALDVDYDDAIAAAENAYDTAIAPYQVAYDDAYSAWLIDPEDPQLQADLQQAENELNASIGVAESQRADDYAAALAAWQTGMDDADDTLAAVEQAAYDDYLLATEDADGDLTDAETDAEDAYQLAFDDADDQFTLASEPWYSDYSSALEELESDLDDAEAAIVAQYADDVADALTAWETAEGTAWTAYTTVMAAVPGTPAVEARVEEPAPEVEFQQPRPLLRPFGGALRRARAELGTILQTYEIERYDRNGNLIRHDTQWRLGQRLQNLARNLDQRRIITTGILTGDIFDPNTFEYFNNLRPNENSILVTINGIWNSRQDALNVLNTVNTYPVGNRRVAVWNGTHGIAGGNDTIGQIVLNELGAETIADLRAAIQIEIAARALRNNGGIGEKTIYVVGHSQGSEIFFRAMSFLSAETRAMIRFVGVGGQRFVANDMGLRSSVNYYFSDDPVPRLANRLRHRWLYAVTHTFEVHRLPASPQGSGHSWANNYSWMFMTQRGVQPPAGTHEISYGGWPLLFRDLRRNQ